MSDSSSISLENVPAHIAIVMDGNGRWAQKQNKPRAFGHKHGVEAVRNVLQYCQKYSIKYLTLFAFSSENWKRPKEEVSSLMGLFLMALDREAKALAKNGVCLKFIGDRSAFSEKLQKKIKHVEELTANGETLFLQIAANYGGRWDIVQAAQALAERGEDINEDSLGRCLATNGLAANSLQQNNTPEPDLFIRTGGEQRISNFLLWQCAYSELYFTDTLWPDFDEQAFKDALLSYTSRFRRFGQTSEQISAS